MNSYRLAKILILLVFAFQSHAQTGTDIDLERIKRATVFIYQAQNLENELLVKCVSTGTLISADGLIISNAHSILPSRQCDGDTLIVSLNVDLDEPPIPKYRAVIAGADEGLDIALLRIARELGGRLIARTSLPVLPFVNIGNSAAVDIDDNLLVVGYPDLGNSPLAITRGTVTAFIAEPIGGNRSWFKTRAEIPGTMSGGGAYNSVGQLIGIPTNAPFGGPGALANCQFINDTNQDGLVNNSDSCVPTGDFISTIRPIQLAQGLIRGARLGLDVELVTTPDEPPPPLQAPAISRLFFSPAIIDGMPSTVVGSMPANTKSLYLFFDYDNMSADTVYELRVSRDGIPDTVFSLPPVRWSGGENGLWYIGGREQSWANGTYEFTILINGTSVGSQQIIIGGGADNSGHFSDIVFGLLDSSNNLVGNGSILPVGSVASARFLFANMRDGQPWTAIWYFEGAEIARTENNWFDGNNGSKVIGLKPDGGLLPGNYRLELYIEGALSATSDFVVAGRQSGPLPTVFSSLRYTSAETAVTALSAPASSSFPSSIPALFALFDWQGIAAGTPWTLRWLVDDQVFYQRTNPWVTLDSGSDFIVSLPEPPDGNYKLQLLINNLKLAEEEAIIGIGQLPIDRFAEFEGTILSGKVIDASTQLGIPSVTIVLVSEDFAASEFTWQQDQVFALATSDRNGDFQFARPLLYDTPYSIVLEADGYIPQAADNFSFSADQPYVNISIELVRG